MLFSHRDLVPRLRLGTKSLGALKACTYLYLQIQRSALSRDGTSRASDFKSGSDLIEGLYYI